MVCLIKVEQKTITKNKKDSGSIDEKTNLILPYIRGYSEKIERFCRKLNVRVIFKYHNTIRKYLMTVKKKQKKKDKMGVVYEIPCQKCEKKLHRGDRKDTFQKNKRTQIC